MLVSDPPVRKFRFGWFGDGGLGDRLIQAVLDGRKTATSCPIYDPEDAELKAGDLLELTDKTGAARGRLVVTRIEIRAFGDFDEELASKEGTTLAELRAHLVFANGRDIRAEEEMRIVYFKRAG